jgi:hypothetical protein
LFSSLVLAAFKEAGGAPVYSLAVTASSKLFSGSHASAPHVHTQWGYERTAAKKKWHAWRAIETNRLAHSSSF